MFRSASPRSADHWGDQSGEDFEAAIELLQELNHFRGEAIKLRARFAPTMAPSLDPLLQEPVAAPPEAPIFTPAPVGEPALKEFPIEAEPAPEEENFEARRLAPGKPPPRESTPPFRTTNPSCCA